MSDQVCKNGSFMFGNDFYCALSTCLDAAVVTTLILCQFCAGFRTTEGLRLLNTFVFSSSAFCHHMRLRRLSLDFKPLDLELSSSAFATYKSKSRIREVGPSSHAGATTGSWGFATHPDNAGKE